MKKTFLLTFSMLFAVSSAAFSDTKTEGEGLWDYFKDRIQISGYAHGGFQYDTYDLNAKAAFNRFNLTRGMLIARVEPIDGLYLRFMCDVVKFNLHELYAEYRVCDWFQIRFGQYKTPFTLESNISPSVLEIIQGAQAVQYLAGINGSDACFGAGAGRDLGLMAKGEFLNVGHDSHKLFAYSIGVFNGEPFNVRETNNSKDLSAMLSVSPVKGLKFAGSLYWGTATAKAENAYGAFAEGDTYRRSRWSAGLDFRRGPVYVRSEYLEGKDADIRSRGAYATLSASACRWLDIIASVDYFDRNLSLGDWQIDYIVGLQWNIARKCRLQLQYVYQQRNPAAKGVLSGVPSSHLVISQLQIGF